jgi:hypothetical protein
MSKKRRARILGRKAKTLNRRALNPQDPEVAQTEADQSSSLLKRSAAITLLIMGAGSLSIYAAARSRCSSDDWNQPQYCRSHAGGVHINRSNVDRGGFGKTGAAHSAGG